MQIFQFSDVVSIVALALSFFVFGWTIYRDAIQRPKFRVKVSIKRIVGGGRAQLSDPFISVDALNLGPLDNRVGIISIRKNLWRTKVLREHGSYAVVFHDHNHVATNQVAREHGRVTVGDSATFAIPISGDCFLTDDYVKLGVTDGYGRTHWCKNSDIRNAKSSDDIQNVRT